MSYQSLRHEISSIYPNTTIVCVSKYHSIPQMLDIYHQGCRDFGESRVQEALAKMEQMASDIRWHLVGTLQKNKVRKVLGKFALIHSVDTPELARKISECGQEEGMTTNILLQVNTSGESSKHGMSPKEWKQVYKELLQLPNIKIQGLMTMAPLTEDQEIIRRCFASLRLFKDELDGPVALPYLSMGMSHDYPIALEEGASHIRLGRVLFSSTGSSTI